MERLILLNPGPVVVSDRVRNALMGPDLCHREPEFSQILGRVRQKLLRVFDGDESYTTVVFTGSGTACLDAALCAAVESRALVLSNGAYGERLEQILAAYGLDATVLRSEYGEPLRYESAAKLLEDDRGIDTVAMVHHETSTGMLNPLREMSDICARYGRTFVVDAISSLGAEDLSVRRDGIDYCVSTANKCIHGLPGVSFVCAKRSRLEEAKQRKRTFYLDLYEQFYREEYRGETPFTPAVQIFYALEAALDELLEGGIGSRIERYAALAGMIRDGIAALGLHLMLPREHYSNSITSILLPEGISYSSLHDAVKEAGYVVYAGQGPMSERFFRVANMGALTPAHIGGFLEALDGSVRELSAPGW